VTRATLLRSRPNAGAAANRWDVPERDVVGSYSTRLSTASWREPVATAARQGGAPERP